MKINRHKRLKSIGVLSLAFMLALTLITFVPKQTMAAGGTVTVKLAGVEGLSEGTEFRFEMYKVGHFSGPGLVLEDALSGSGADVSFPSGSTEEESVKAERMLASARRLAGYIDDNKIELDTVASFSLKPGESRAVQVSENALYLVRSHTVRDASSENAKFNWTPQPVYVATLDGDSGITISNDVVTKIVRTPVSLNHQLRKSWENIPEGKEDELKPDAVFVNIRYGNKIVDTVKLNEDNSWAYKWDSEEDGDTYKYIGKDDAGETKIVEFKPDMSDPQDAPVWSCDEVLDAEDYAASFEDMAYENVRARSFSEEEAAAIAETAMRFTVGDPEISADTPTDLIEITNTYSKNKLELTKRLDGYVDAGDRSNVTMAFRVVAADKHGNEIYNNIVGITFAMDDPVDSEGFYSKTREITDIPVNADEITVTEVYSAQYEGDTPKSKKAGDIKWDDEKNMWTVTMDNTHAFHEGSGVVNMYGDGELKDQAGAIKH